MLVKPNWWPVLLCCVGANASASCLVAGESAGAEPLRRRSEPRVGCLRCVAAALIL